MINRLPKWLQLTLTIIMSCVLLYEIFLITPLQRLATAPQDCDYELPTSYKLLYNEKAKNYVIERTTYSGFKEYLSLPVYLNDYHWHLLEDCNKFKDSCRAKGALKRHLKQEADKWNYTQKYKSSYK